MNISLINNHSVPLSDSLMVRLSASLELCPVPNDAKRIALNFKNAMYLKSRHGIRPVEVHLYRDTQDCPWHISMMASFAFPDESSRELEVELYFNFSHGWFYQPDITNCDLHQPKVVELLEVWDKAFVDAINTKQFSQLTLNVLKTL